MLRRSLRYHECHIRSRRVWWWRGRWWMQRRGCPCGDGTCDGTCCSDIVFHAREGKEAAVAAELRDAVARTSKEPGCLGIEVYRSVRDSRLFFLHSRWVNEAAFDRHVTLPETNQFVDRVQPLIDQPFDVNRTHLLR